MLDIKQLPAELTLRQMATLLGLTVPAIRYRVKQGVIPTRRISEARASRFVIPMDVVRRDYEWLWNAIVHRTQTTDFSIEELDDE